MALATTSRLVVGVYKYSMRYFLHDRQLAVLIFTSFLKSSLRLETEGSNTARRAGGD